MKFEVNMLELKSLLGWLGVQRCQMELLDSSFSTWLNISVYTI